MAVAALLTLSAVGLAVAAPTPASATPGEGVGAPVVVESVVAGGVHTCALLDDGAVKCWGHNDSGQLGYGDTTLRGWMPGQMGDALPAVDLGTGRTATAIIAGFQHTCALLDDGTVKCWGNNSFGWLGYGDTASRGDGPGEMGDALPQVDLGTGRTATAITTGVLHTCALLDDATVKCWGYGSNGQLGYGNAITRGDGPGEMGDALPTVNLGTGRTATAIIAGGYHTCALLDNGPVKCWGHGGAGSLGYGNPITRGDGPGEMGDALPAVNLGTGRTAIAITAGDNHTCALLDDDTVKCWGAGHSGQLGYGDTANRGDGPGEMGDALPAVGLGTGRTAVAISAGRGDMCAVLDNANVKCWGLGDGGRLGYGDTITRGDGPGEMGDALPAVDLGTGRTATAITAGWEHTCARFDDGAVKCWGNGGAGQLGYGESAIRGDGPGEMGDALPTVNLGGDPSVAIVTPADGATYGNDAEVLADFGCDDETAVDSCVGDVGDGEAIDTSTLGEQTFTVVATDTAGNQTTLTHDYTVVDDTDPTVIITTPADGASYDQGEEVLADFACDDETAVDTCAGDVAGGEAIDTSTLGGQTFTVVATDTAGNQTTVTHDYTVVDGTDPTVIITTPADGAAYSENAVVLADFTCTDDIDSEPSCVGDVGDGEAIDTSTLGEQSFTVTATDAAGNQGTVTHDYTVVDGTDPSVTITTPADGATYSENAVVLADFTCTDDIDSEPGCVGDVGDGEAIDTSTLGEQTFTVVAMDTAGNQTTLTHDYTVVDGTDPTVTIVAPADGASYGQGEEVLADFSCDDETAVDTCVGDVGDGEAVDTSSLGEQTFTVVATDTAGNETTVTHDYTVVDATDPDATINTPANGATYTRGEEVLAHYSCTDDVDGESTGCVGDVDSGEPIDTNTLGEHTFTVIATDTADNTATVAHAYTVIAPRCDGRAVTVMLALGDTPTAGDDVILGTPGPDTINALGGNDRICGLSGNDTINAGTGNDRVRGDADRDRVRGGGGNDRLLGQMGNDTLNGGTGADTLNGGPQRDTCTGGPQRDTQTACEIRRSIP